MEFRSIIWTTLTLLLSVHSFKLDPLGLITEGLYLVHDVPNPMGISSARHAREVARVKQHRPRDMLFPYKYCCGGENNTEDSRKNESVNLVKQCMQELYEEDEWATYGNPTKDPFSCDRTKSFKERFSCFFNCLMRGEGVLGDDGTEDIEKWEELTTEPLAFPWLKDLTVSAFHKCIANNEYSWLKNGDKLKCSPRVIDVSHCVWSQVIMTCPEEHFEENAYCKRVKEAFEEVDG